MAALRRRVRAFLSDVERSVGVGSDDGHATFFAYLDHRAVRADVADALVVEVLYFLHGLVLLPK